MIQPGFQINSELLNGRNALHYATDYGQAEVIKYLVGKGAKLDVSLLCLPPMCVCVCVCVRVCVHPSVKVSLLKNSQLYYTISTLSPPCSYQTSMASQHSWLRYMKIILTVSKFLSTV